MIRILTLSFLLLSFVAPSYASAESKRLSIRPAAQKTAVWCWAAVGEMVLKYYDFPNLNPGRDFQCGVVGSTGGACASYCGNCVYPIGSTSRMARVLEDYQDISDHYISNHHGTYFDVYTDGRLSPSEIMSEIKERDPVIAGISPSGMGSYYPIGMSEHVALIIGYRRTGNKFHVLVNDPMPYGRLGYDPFLHAGATMSRPGQYWIDYEDFVGRLSYKDSIVLD